MYSVVLMMALTSTTDAPDCHRHRCDGCHGGCYGGGYGGCHGGWSGCHGCHGGYGYGAYGYGTPYAGGYYGSYWTGEPIYYSTYGGMQSGYRYGVPTDGGYYIQPGERLNAAEGSGQAPATIRVQLPADATLTIDGSATRSTDEVRTFVSPPLQAGKEYQYTIRAEVMRDGKKMERSRDVTVRAGQQSDVTFDLPKKSAQEKE